MTPARPEGHAGPEERVWQPILGRKIRARSWPTPKPTDFDARGRRGTRLRSVAISAAAGPNGRATY